MNKKLFFDLYRAHIDKNNKLTQREVNALQKFIDMVVAHKDYFTINQWAYVFATTFHETAFTFEPVREAFQLSERWRKHNLRYFPYYGRGYVQLTWDFNYERYSDILCVDLVNNPDLALDEHTAFQILIHGMKEGIYTGKRLDRYVNDFKKDYERARYVVNGRDKRDIIASYARTFESILKQTL